jgi:hypothetical protein
MIKLCIIIRVYIILLLTVETLSLTITVKYSMVYKQFMHTSKTVKVLHLLVQWTL